MRAHTLTPVMLLALAGAAMAGSFPASMDLGALDGTDGFVLLGVAASDLSGWSISSVGDVNGDGIDDIVIGARGAATGSYLSAGAAYVVFGGRCVGAVGSYPLASLDGTNGFVIRGIAEGDRSGWSVSHADLNNDGLDDVIVGAPDADPGGVASAGQVYVVFGRDTASEGEFPASLDPASMDGSDGFIIEGVVFDSGTGSCVSSAGDVNGDGVEDAIIGTDGYANEVYIVFGRDTGTQGSFPATVSLGSLSGSDGFVVHGIDPYDYIGMSVAGAGDVNGDGTDDIVFGAPYASPNAQPYSGASYVIFGGPTVGGSGAFDLASLDGTNGFMLAGVDTYDAAGTSVASAGDVDGDGIADVIIGAERASPGATYYAGETYIVFGRDTATEGNFPATLDLASLDGANGLAVPGRLDSSGCGSSVSGVGDVNSDGMDDVVIGTWAYGNVPGEAYVIFGRDTASQGGFPASVHPASLDGSSGFIAHGPADANELHVSSCGDINNDGLADLLLSAADADVGSAAQAGETYVLFGGPPVLVDHTHFRAHGVADGLPSIACVVAADLDGDLDEDLVTSGPSIQWYENDGSPQPTWTPHVLSTEAEGGAINVEVVDFDDDGDLDILAASGAWGDSIEWFESDGLSPPGFTRRLVQDGLSIPRCASAIDLDGDGDLDIGSALMGADTIEWYESDGAEPPVFTRHILITDALVTQFVTGADLDGDADGDLIYAAPTDDRVAWLENLGGMPPTFDHHILASDPDGPEAPQDGIADGVRQVRTVDIDDDGDLDIVAACSGSARVLLFLNDGQAPPQFTTMTVFNPTNVGAVIPIDMDGDCDIDIVQGSGTDHLVAWHENDGGSPPAWTMHVITTVGQNHKFIDAADFDGNGTIDVVSVSFVDGWVAWYESGHCRTDLTGDGPADVFDFGVFANNFGLSGSFLSNGDFDGNGEVNVLDFGILAPDFGCTP